MRLHALHLITVLSTLKPGQLIQFFNGLKGDNIILEVSVKFIISRSQQTVSVKGQIVNILGFVGHMVSVLILSLLCMTLSL